MMANQWTEPRVGMSVKVVARSDAMMDGKFRGKVGKIVRWVTDDVGATPKDPLVIVEFRLKGSKKLEKDGFWTEELRLLGKRSQKVNTRPIKEV